MKLVRHIFTSWIRSQDFDREKLIIYKSKETLKGRENLTLCIEKINLYEANIIIDKSNKLFIMSMRYYRCNTLYITINNIKKIWKAWEPWDGNDKILFLANLHEEQS